MSRRLITLALATGAFVLSPRFAFGADDLGTPARATAPTERPVARLVIDTSGMFEDEREHTARWIREDGVPVLADAGVTVDDSSTALEIRVAVRVDGVGYAVETSVWRPGAEVPEVDRGRRVCEACVRSEVLQLVTRDLAWVGGWLTVQSAPAEPEASPAPGDEPEEEPAEVDPGPTVEPDRQPASGQSKVLRNAGLALVVPGGVALGVGVGLVVAGMREVESPNAEDTVIAERNYRPPGIALAVFGGAAAAAGVALLVVHARRDRAGRSARMAWSPTLGGTHAGFVITGRF